MTVDLAVAVQSRDLDTAEARHLIDGMRADVADLGGRITTAYLGRAWLALGYASWDALCEAEFEGARLRLPRENRAEQVQSLRSAGLSTRAIGAALGVDKRTVARDLTSTGAVAPVDQPTTVQSLDGRTRPASQPARHAVHVTTTEKTVEEFIADRDTGEVLSPDDWQAAQAVQDFVDGGDDLRRARHVHTFSKLAVQAGEGLPLLDVQLLASDLAADPFAEDLFSQAVRLRRRLNDWFDALEAARPRGLRVVEG